MYINLIVSIITTFFNLATSQLKATTHITLTAHFTVIPQNQDTV